MVEVRLTIPFQIGMDFNKRFYFTEKGWTLLVSKSSYDLLKSLRDIDEMDFCGELLVCWRPELKHDKAILSNINF